MESTLPALKPIYHRRSTCRACHVRNLEPILNLGMQFLPRFEADIDYSLPRAPLELVRCEGCGLLQLAHTVDPDLLYREFHYRSGINQTMRDGLKDLVQDGLSYHEKGNWLDIGANDGYLLSQLPKPFTRFACEPALNFREELNSIAHVTASEYFSGNLFKDKFDVITSAACFYDVDDPGQFVADVARSLKPHGVWLNQLNDSPGMISANAFDAICHEHLCFFDVPSLQRLYRQHGLEIVDISHNDINGGSMRISAQKAGVAPTADVLGLHAVSREDAVAFGRRTEAWKMRMVDLLHGLAHHGPIWCAGASTKGTVLLQYLDRPSFFAGVGDRNPLKHGKRMAGSWLNITSEEEMRAAKPGVVVVLPWAFFDEILDREAELRASGTAFVFPLPHITVVL